MRACADALTVKRAACSDRPDMSARVHAAITDTCASGHHGTGMAAGGNAVAIHARTRTNAADMGAGTHAMFADMRTHSDTQYLNIRADGISSDGREHGKREEGGSEHFHVHHPVG
jgi:hypothetical protein